MVITPSIEWEHLRCFKKPLNDLVYLFIRDYFQEGIYKKINLKKYLEGDKRKGNQGKENQDGYW